MAKQNRVKKLTRRQLAELANKLSNNRMNVYTTAENMFGFNVGEEVFEQLESHARIFKCENCDIWLPTTEKDRDIEGFCTECVDEMNEDEADEGDLE